MGRITLARSLHMMHSCGAVSRGRVGFEQMTSHMDVRQCRTRFAEIASREAAETYPARVQRHYSNPDSWGALRFVGGTRALAAQAFRTTSASYCSLQALLCSSWAGFPYILWLLHDLPPLARHAEAQRLLELPACLRDPWSAEFLGQYNTPERRLSVDALGLLTAFGSTMRLDIFQGRVLTRIVAPPTRAPSSSSGSRGLGRRAACLRIARPRASQVRGWDRSTHACLVFCGSAALGTAVMLSVIRGRIALGPRRLLVSLSHGFVNGVLYSKSSGNHGRQGGIVLV